MTTSNLSTFTCKDLAQMAKKQGVRGWHSMRKDQLIRALAKAAKQGSATRRSVGNGTTVRPSKSINGKPAVIQKRVNTHVQQQISQLQSKLESIKNLAAVSDNGSSDRVVSDRLIVMVRDPYWLHAYWELSHRSVQRSQAAMGQYWHTAKPVLQLYEVADDGTAAVLRSIDIHGGVNNWYVDVPDPPKQFRLEIGYLAADDSFHCMARSNTVTTPPLGVSDALDQNWADVSKKADRIFAMSGGYSPQGTSLELQELLEERLRRPMGSPMHTRYGAGAGSPLTSMGEFHFAVDAEIIVYGVTHKDAHVTLKGEPVPLRADGTFAVRLNLPDRRQVIPVVASTSDGVEQRTIVVAVERNTKVMEPKIRDSNS